MSRAVFAIWSCVHTRFSRSSRGTGMNRLLGIWPRICFLYSSACCSSATIFSRDASTPAQSSATARSNNVSSSRADLKQVSIWSCIGATGEAPKTLLI